MAVLMATLCALPVAAKAADPAIMAAESSVRLGVSAGYGQYEENIRPQDTESGALVGVRAGLSVLRPQNFSLGGLSDLYSDVEYDFSAGFLNYRGAVNTPQTPAYNSTDRAYYNDVVVRLGLGMPLAGRMELIPYLAGGYQNWYRNIGGLSGYGELYQAGLLGGGLRLDIASGQAWVVSASAEGLAVIGGSIAVPSQNFNGNFGTSAQERISLNADYRLNSAWHAFAGLGVTNYSYTGTKPNTSGLFEPLSTTLQVNSSFGIAYGF